MKKEESKTTHGVYVSNSDNLSKRADQEHSSSSTGNSREESHLFSAQTLDKKIKRNQNFKSLPHVSEILIYTSRVQKAPDWKLI